jgi:hydrogenase expression/formation protein HypC
MCLSVPAKIITIEGEMAVVSVGGTEYNACLQLIENPQIGDYVLLHTGFAIQKLSEDEAIETLKTFDEFEEFNKGLDEQEKLTGERIV